MFGLMMVLVTITFQLGESTFHYYAHLMLWSCVAALSLRLMVRYGKEFVVLPILCPPYDDPAYLTTNNGVETFVNVEDDSPKKK